ncbi:alpha/beta hydrolase [Bartonella sp. DGB1]|uniref:alpha/beta hydrolase n=1 Tax=Bartonella sp. DGB1 TaxID=3239807 RepID=UPI00352478FF
MQYYNWQKTRHKNISIYLFALTDDLSLRYAIAEPKNFTTTRGTIFLVPDYNDKIEYYFNIMKNLAQRGYYVVILDYCPIAINDIEIKKLKILPFKYKDYIYIFKSFLKRIVFDKGLGATYIIAHGVGAKLVLEYFPELNNHIERIILIAPWIKPYKGISNLLNLYKTFRDKYTNKLEFNNNIFTNCEKIYQKNMAINKDISLKKYNILSFMSFVKMFLSIKNIRFILNQVKIPVLFITCGEDKAVENQAIEQLSRKIRASSHISIKDAKHDLFQENKDIIGEFLTIFENFVPGSSLEDIKLTKDFFNPSIKKLV